MQATEEKAKKKAGQKRKRQTPVAIKSSSEGLRGSQAEDSAFLQQFGADIPPSDDFATVMRVYRCVVRIAEVTEESPEVELLKKKLKKAEAINTDVEADLIDRQDKLDYLNGFMILDLIEKNSLFRGVVNSLSNVESEIVEAEALLDVGSFDAEEVLLVAAELEEARRLESEARAEVETLRRKVRQLESKLQGEEEKINKAGAAGFSHARELVLSLELGVEPELLSLENIVDGRRITWPTADKEPEVLFEPEEQVPSKPEEE